MDRIWDKNIGHCMLRCITLINVSRNAYAGILLLFVTAYEYFDPPTHQKIYIYNFFKLNFILFLGRGFYCFLELPAYIFIRVHIKYAFICLHIYSFIILNSILFSHFTFLYTLLKKILRMFWNAYTFQNIFENYFLLEINWKISWLVK